MTDVHKERRGEEAKGKGQMTDVREEGKGDQMTVVHEHVIICRGRIGRLQITPLSLSRLTTRRPGRRARQSS